MSLIMSVTPPLPWRGRARGCAHCAIDRTEPAGSRLTWTHVRGGRLDRVGWRWLCDRCKADPRIIV